MDATLDEARQITGADKGEALIMEQVARDAGMSEMYDGFYRALSMEHTHLTVMSLQPTWLLDEKGNVNGWRWGPASFEGDKLDWLLTMISLVGICLVEQANTLLKNDEVAAEFAAIVEVYRTLIPTRPPSS